MLLFVTFLSSIIMGGFSLKKVCEGDGDWFMFV
jgi:hypothetical protein